jgi:hypothetical protein
MTSTKTLMLSAAAALLAMAGIASAAVTFDPQSGTGFVGKGDVQLVFGWNNKALQQNAEDVTFKSVTSQEFEAYCQFTSGSGSVQNVRREEIRGINGVIDGSPRQGPNQFTGFILDGYEGDPVVIGGAIPVVGGFCPGGPTGDGEWTSVTPGQATVALYATHNSIDKQLQ